MSGQELDTVIDGEIVDDTELTEPDAMKLTARIRAWVKACPIEDIKRAFFGRVWLAMGYGSWSEWCDCELDGFRLPAVERRGVVAELAQSGMSNGAIADITGVTEWTVRDDQKQLRGNHEVDECRRTVGKDGKSRPAHRPVPGHIRDASLNPRLPMRRRGLLRHDEILDRAATSLEGMCVVLDDFEQFNDTVDAGKALLLMERLSKSIRTLNRINRLLKDRAE